MGGRTDVARASLVAVAIGLATAAPAQDLAPRAVAPPTAAGDAETPQSDDQVTFSAANLDYDDNADIVTATGDVHMLRAGSRLRADKVVWNRKTGRIVASGDVATVDPGGDTSYADTVDLTDDMKEGVADDLLLVLADGGRLAARQGSKQGDQTLLDHAAYTPCRVVDADNCPRRPSWQITALRVTVDQNKHRIYYRDARFRLFGVTVLALPGLSHPDGSGIGGGGSGLLLPNVQYGKTNGLEVDLPYYLQLAPNRDLTITPRLYTGVLPALEGLYRNLDGKGAFQIRALATYGSRLPADINPLPGQENRGVRGFIDANGTWQLSPNWTIHGAIRVETDPTFMKRYDISNDDRLRSTIRAERIDADSYLSIAGWFVQEIRRGYSQGRQPIALPEIDYRRRIADPWLGGIVQVELNSLALTRTEGQDTQRAFANLRWDLTRITRWGQQVTFTAYGRADLYHTAQAGETGILAYQGVDGWQKRGIGLVAVDMRWPFVGELFGGTQQIVPRVQMIAEPHTKNITIPNEDSRAVDLDDSNLFALNRFSGYDRWEDSSRVTYGAEWNYTRPAFETRAVIGQSYRLSTDPTILPPGTGLSERFSDYVGRVTIKYGNFVEVTERFRLDKGNLAVRRNEIDASFGTRNTYALVGYLRLNRKIDQTIADLRDDSEVRFAGRVQIARYWSVFGSTVIDLTKRSADPTSLSDGFSPVRHRAGITYENECISLGLQWRKDFDPTGDARRGSTFSLRLALKNVGR